MRIFKIIIIACFLIISEFYTYAQKTGSDNEYVALYEKGEYNEALKIIKEKLLEYYRSNPDNQKFVSDFIYIEKEDEWEDLYDRYRSRKLKTFFIEDNAEISGLHLYAARCYDKNSDFNEALNHYYTSLRFKNLEPVNDAEIFYEISQVNKNSFQNRAYLRSLETAYSLKPLNYEFSLELGKAFASSGNREKAIYHLERYLDSNPIKPDIQLYLILGNLYEDAGKYLKTEENYKKYLEIRDDGYVYFALGHISFKRTGNYRLALECFGKSMLLLPENDIFRRSKAMEYRGDIFMSNREYEKAVDAYEATRKYQQSLQEEINNYNDKIKKITEDIGKIENSGESEMVFEKYSEYRELKDEKAETEFRLQNLIYEYKKLNAGRIRWNLAELSVRIENLEQAVLYYQEAAGFNYQPNKAREMIQKLQLKIARGY